MFNDLDVVVLLKDRPEYNLRAGHMGTIVHVHTPTMFMVEFSDRNGRTFEMPDLPASDLLKVLKVPDVVFEDDEQDAAAA